MVKVRELEDKPQEALQKILQEKRGRIQRLRFKLSQGKLKNVSEIKSIKKDIARILTVLNQKAKTKTSK